MTSGAPNAPDEAAMPRPRTRRSQGFLTPRRLLELAYVALLGFLLVRLVHLATAPITVPDIDAGAQRQAVEADLSVLSRHDPFGADAEAVPLESDYADAEETTLNLRLVGVSFGGGIKTATIVLPDGRQDAVAVGQEVIGGVTLRDVVPNQAILSRNGLTETLTLKDRDGRTASTRRPPRAATTPQPNRPAIASPGEALELLSRSIRFEPSIDGGFAVAPGADPRLFDQAGLREGDVVTAVEGMPAPRNPAEALALMADLPPGRPFVITVEREGEPLDVPVDLGSIE